MCILINDGRCDVTLEHTWKHTNISAVRYPVTSIVPGELTSTECKDNETDNERCEAAAGLEHTGQCREYHDDMRYTAYEDADANSLVLSQLGVRNPAAKERHSIRQECE